MNRTKTDAALAAAAEAHADDPERVEALERARRFKSSGIQLAEVLTEVRRNGHWDRWGYASFEAYTKGELHLRPETVDKLTGSYQFLQRRAPEVLGRDGVKTPIPSYQAIDFLRRAESQEGAPDETVSEIRRRVLDEAATLPAVARQYREAVFPLDKAERKRRDTAALRNVAGRLRELLDETHAVSRGLAGEVQNALDRLLAALQKDEERAA
jgi:hypothetical protein